MVYYKQLTKNSNRNTYMQAYSYNTVSSTNHIYSEIRSTVTYYLKVNLAAAGQITLKILNGAQSKILSTQNTSVFEYTFTPLNGYSQFQIDTQQSIVNLELYSLKDIFAQLPTGATVNRFGIQGVPKQIFSVNGSNMYIGRSGLYELNNPLIDKSFLGIVPNDNNFIIDIEYQI